MNPTKIKNFLLDILFPPLCPACKTRLTAEERQNEWKSLCGKCSAQIEINNSFYCPRCGRRLPEAKKSCHPETKFILAAATAYQNPVARELIHSLKYQGVKTAMEPLSQILNLYLKKVGGDLRSFTILPIPLHAKKEKERGFNQAFLIAEAASRYLGAPIERNNLVKIKNTASQTELPDYEKRKENMNGAFALKNADVLKGKNVILVDDVFTSGATMNEAVRLLKSVGAKKIIALVIAKA